MFSYISNWKVLQFIPETIPKNLRISEKIDWIFSARFFVITSLIKSTESTISRGFESKHKLCFTVYTWNIPKYNFSKHQNQLRAMSILSHMWGADSGHSWLVLSDYELTLTRNWTSLALSRHQVFGKLFTLQMGILIRGSRLGSKQNLSCFTYFPNCFKLRKSERP